MEQQLDDNKQAERATLAAEQSPLTRLDDPAFIQGFGNNGGEEFLSYMLVRLRARCPWPPSRLATP